MKDKNINTLLEKYESGISSSNDEKYLLKHVDKSFPLMERWFKFVKQNKSEAPKDFNDKLWEKFDDKTQTNRKLLIRVLSIAASIVLIVSLFFGNTQQDELSYQKKAALLNQAIKMTTDKENDIAKQDIIYEDNTIIIFTKSE